jgi:hypothetical protein
MAAMLAGTAMSVPGSAAACASSNAFASANGTVSFMPLYTQRQKDWDSRVGSRYSPSTGVTPVQPNMKLP